MTGTSALSDFIIIGGGIIGLTTAFTLRQRYPKARITLLEKEGRLGVHASGRNSGVLHSGIYYGSDTLKAKVCARGAERMRAFAAENGVPCRRSGKVILAVTDEELPTLDRLAKNGRDNNIRIERLDAKGIRKIEPYANPDSTGIYCPDTSVIDIHAVIEKLHEIIARLEVTVLFNQEVIDIRPENNMVITPHARFGYGFMFNCAGANADRIARKFGLSREYVLLPFKGLYYKLHKRKDHLVKSNIYPVPNIGLPFLGVHLTRLIDGGIYVGPTAIPALGRENYGVLKGLRPVEGFGIGIQLAGMYLHDHENFRYLVHTEMKKYLKRYFLKAAQRLVPDITSGDLVSCDKVGIRPQLVNIKTKKLEMDFIFQNTPSSLHVLNAISPAFTSSFAFADLIVDHFQGIK